jgi:hypothetical protein
MSSSNSSHDSSSSDEEMLFDEMDQKVVMFFQCIFNVLNFKNLITDHEDEWTKKFVDQAMWVEEVLAMMQATPFLFKNFTNFMLIEFEELTN